MLVFIARRAVLSLRSGASPLHPHHVPRCSTLLLILLLLGCQQPVSCDGTTSSPPAPSSPGTPSPSQTHHTTDLQEHTSPGIYQQDPPLDNMFGDFEHASTPSFQQTSGAPMPRRRSPPKADKVVNGGRWAAGRQTEARRGLARWKVGARVTQDGEFPWASFGAGARQRQGRVGHLGRLNEQAFPTGPRGTPNPGGGQGAVLPSAGAGVFSSLPDTAADVVTLPPLLLERKMKLIDIKEDKRVRAATAKCILCSADLILGGRKAAAPAPEGLRKEGGDEKQEKRKDQQQYRLMMTKCDACLRNGEVAGQGVAGIQGGGGAARERQAHQEKARHSAGATPHREEKIFSTNVLFNADNIATWSPVAGDATIGHVPPLDGHSRARRPFGESQVVHSDPDARRSRTAQHTHPLASVPRLTPTTVPSLIPGQGGDRKSPAAAPHNGDEASVPHNGSQERHSLADDASQVEAGLGEGAQRLSSPGPHPWLRPRHLRHPSPLNNGERPPSRPWPKQVKEGNISPLTTSTEDTRRGGEERGTDNPDETMDVPYIADAFPLSVAEGEAHGDIKPKLISRPQEEEEEKEEEEEGSLVGGIVIVFRRDAAEERETHVTHSHLSAPTGEVIDFVSSEEDQQQQQQQQQQQRDKKHSEKIAKEEEKEEKNIKKVTSDGKRKEEEKEEWRSVLLGKDSHANLEEEEDSGEKETPIKIKEGPTRMTDRRRVSPPTPSGGGGGGERGRGGGGGGGGGKTQLSSSLRTLPASRRLLLFPAPHEDSPKRRLFPASLRSVRGGPPSGLVTGKHRQGSRHNEGKTLSRSPVSPDVVTSNGDFFELSEGIIREFVSWSVWGAGRLRVGAGGPILAGGRGRTFDPSVTPPVVIYCDAASSSNSKGCFVSCRRQESANSSAVGRRYTCRARWRGKRSVEGAAGGTRTEKSGDKPHKRQRVGIGRGSPSREWKWTGWSLGRGQHRGRRRRGTKPSFIYDKEGRRLPSLYSRWVAALRRRSHKGDRKAEAGSVLHFIDAAVGMGYPARHAEIPATLTQFQNLSDRPEVSSTLNLNKKVLKVQSNIKHEERAETFSRTPRYSRARSPRATTTPRRAQRSPPPDVSRSADYRRMRTEEGLTLSLKTSDQENSVIVPEEEAAYINKYELEEAREVVTNTSLKGAATIEYTALMNDGNNPSCELSATAASDSRGNDSGNFSAAACGASDQQQRSTEESPIENTQILNGTRGDQIEPALPFTPHTEEVMTQFEEIDLAQRDGSTSAPPGVIDDAGRKDEVTNSVVISDVEDEALDGANADSNNSYNSTDNNYVYQHHNYSNAGSNDVYQHHYFSNTSTGRNVSNEENIPVVIHNNCSGSGDSNNINNNTITSKNTEKTVTKNSSTNEEVNWTADSSNSPALAPQHSYEHDEVQMSAAVEQQQQHQKQRQKQQQARKETGTGSSVSGGIVPEAWHRTGQAPSRRLGDRSGARIYARGLYWGQIGRKSRLQRLYQSRLPSAYLPSSPWAARVHGYSRGHSRASVRANWPLLPLSRKKTTVRALWDLSHNDLREATGQRSASPQAQAGLMTVPDGGESSRPVEGTNLTSISGAFYYRASQKLHKSGASAGQVVSPPQHSSNHRVGPLEGHDRLAALSHAQKLSSGLRDVSVAAGVGGTPTTPQPLGRRSLRRKTLNPSAAPKRTVPILGLFDLTVRGKPRLGGRSELAAAQLALRHINEQQVIPGHTLVMFHNDTQVRLAISTTTTDTPARHAGWWVEGWSDSLVPLPPGRCYHQRGDPQSSLARSVTFMEKITAQFWLEWAVKWIGAV
ncbi:hypothetical protein E2C01_040480 [Portunus trituberculatus]|uniref:Uncharacterized protein n=1 Tax=Portunus trituberculatus TaxID=210409 RepID=A0A5B7FQW4_PORTR|nr:hypothetical protein [Portunus trituberculatus]